MTQPPPIPDYARAPKPRGGGGRAALAVFAGLIAGGAVSAIAWIGMWDALRLDSSVFPVFAIAGAKLAAALVLVSRPGRLRFAGIGLLLSVGLGGLIFFGACFSHLSFH